MDFINVSIESFRDFLIYFQVFTALFATIYYYKYKNTFLKYLLFLLWYSLLNDTFAIYYTKNIAHNNTFLYNISQVIETSFYLLLYRNSVKKIINIKSITAFLGMYWVTFIVNILSQNFMTQFYSMLNLIGAFFIVISIVLYFIEILNSDKIILIHKSLICWISIALFIFNIGYIPIIVVRDYYSNSVIIPYIFNLNYILIFIVNLLFIAGFIWSGRNQTD